MNRDAYSRLVFILENPFSISMGYFCTVGLNCTARYLGEVSKSFGPGIRSEEYKYVRCQCFLLCALKMF